MPGEKHLSKGEEVEKAAKIREKKERGETLTREEAGFLGDVASRQSTAREEKAAKESGRGREFQEEHKTKSWMAGEKARAPTPTKETEAEVERIRAKQERGAKLTHHESSVLGGTERAREESE
jgi:hypothetical protein